MCRTHSARDQSHHLRRGIGRVSDYRSLERRASQSHYERAQLPWEAGFLAGKCFLDYRKGGGARATPLPDFYIGAHADIERLALLTRDNALHRTYFPKVEVLAPAKIPV